MYRIVKKKWLTSTICSMEILAKDIAAAAKPGQFLIVRIDEKGERIPLTICDYDIQQSTVSIVFQVVGSSTKQMGDLGEGDFFADVVGPLGVASEFLKENPEELQRKKFLFVAGGVGTAPLYPQVKWLKEHNIGVDVIIGTRNKDTLILEKEMREVAENVFVCTEDGSYGERGLVTDKMKKLLDEGKQYDHAILIGPMVMMKFSSKLCRKYKIPNTVSLNPLMVDGTGMCGACRVSIHGNIKFACVDGPEFNGDEVDFDEAIRRLELYRKGKGEACQNPSCCHFEEVSSVYTLEEAQEEAKRCLQCQNPLCVQGCPVSIDIPGFIQEISKENLAEAAEIISKYSNLPAICGRVCPQETQCEAKCILGKKGRAVAIGKLERFVGDWMLEHIEPQVVEKRFEEKIAVIGGGPAGLTAAGDLAKLGYSVTIFEALHRLGGVLTYGIPEFRLPKEKIVQREIERLLELGVEVQTNTVIGKLYTVDSLLQEKGFSAVFIASGAGSPKFMNIPGENAKGVISANEFLTRVNLMNAHQKDYATPIEVGRKVVVVGGGNVAMDAARTAKRLGAEVTVVYRRGEKELPARREEIVHAKEEGIHFSFLTNPVEILTDGASQVQEIRCVHMQLGEKDESGRASFSVIDGSDFSMEAETVIMALGTSPNPMIAKTTENLALNKWKGIEVLAGGETSREGVFAGGDAVSGAATVILAMESGKKAALSIHEYLRKKAKR